MRKPIHRASERVWCGVSHVNNHFYFFSLAFIFICGSSKGATGKKSVFFRLLIATYQNDNYKTNEHAIKPKKKAARKCQKSVFSRFSSEGGCEKTDFFLVELPPGKLN